MNNEKNRRIIRPKRKNETTSDNKDSVCSGISNEPENATKITKRSHNEGMIELNEGSTCDKKTFKVEENLIRKPSVISTDKASFLEDSADISIIKFVKPSIPPFKNIKPIEMMNDDEYMEYFEHIKYADCISPVTSNRQIQQTHAPSTQCHTPRYPAYSSFVENEDITMHIMNEDLELLRKEVNIAIQTIRDKAYCPKNRFQDKINAFSSYSYLNEKIIKKIEDLKNSTDERFIIIPFYSYLTQRVYSNYLLKLTNKRNSLWDAISFGVFGTPALYNAIRLIFGYYSAQIWSSLGNSNKRKQKIKMKYCVEQALNIENSGDYIFVDIIADAIKRQIMQFSSDFEVIENKRKNIGTIDCMALFNKVTKTERNTEGSMKYYLMLSKKLYRKNS